MDNVGDSFQRGLNTFIDFLPRLLMGLLLILVAWVVATLVKKAIIKGLKATGLASKLQDWGAANNENQGHSMVNALGKVGYFLVWVFFLPGIFYTLGLEAIGQPIQNMLDTAFAFLPNIFSAIVILVLGFYPRFPKNYNVVGGTTPKVLYNCDCFFVISPTRTALPGFSNASMTSNSSSNSCIV